MSWQESYDEFLKVAEGVLGDRGLAERLARGNVDLEEASERIGWKGFERLVLEMLRANGYEAELHHRVGRKEIDVLAYNERNVIVVECKRWNAAYPSALRAPAQRTAEKLRLVLSEDRLRGKAGAAVIVTMREVGARELEGVFVVPIHRLAGFIREIDGVLAEGP